MKFFRHGLRFFITGSSVAGFLGGWILLAHAPKPLADGFLQPAAASAPVPGPLPTLEPVPSLDDDLGRLQPLPSLPQAGFQQLPRLRTGGS